MQSSFYSAMFRAFYKMCRSSIYIPSNKCVLFVSHQGILQGGPYKIMPRGVAYFGRPWGIQAFAQTSLANEPTMVGLERVPARNSSRWEGGWRCKFISRGEDHIRSGGKKGRAIYPNQAILTTSAYTVLRDWKTPCPTNQRTK